MRLTRDRRRPPAQQFAWVALFAVLSAGLWFGWFAWDTEYQFNSATAEMTGPYAVWQGVGAFLCGIVVVGFAYRILFFPVALLVLPASFTIAWSTTAAAEDYSGLWVIGAILVAFGSTAGIALLLGVAALIEKIVTQYRTSATRRRSGETADSAPRDR
ncbi:hypothetical protein E8P82_01470 [Arthrobacter echini]|uniref:Uncharacterized protein n=1 Tax=Arthrobacter echini TaxID=1529066 RepID=A0A4S5EAA5_9MICC|nr:hypothetical protein [Arthrobacter echini]THJ68604.1 hypothetical protein E8P82_01470 [Arthrobacter echini]